MSVGPTQTLVYRDDPVVVLKCLTMISELLRPRDVEKLSPILRGLLDNFIDQSVASENEDIKKAALKALGCCCLRDAKAAKHHMVLLLHVSSGFKCFYTERVWKALVE